MIRAIRYAVAAACVMLVASSPVLAEAPQEMPSLDLHDGMRLGAVLERLNAHGLRIVYSSALVLDDMQLRANVTGQWTRDALVPGEQFGIGGLDNLRSMHEREGASDRGYRASIELYSPDVGSKFGMDGGRLRFFGSGR